MRLPVWLLFCHVTLSAMLGNSIITLQALMKTYLSKQMMGHEVVVSQAQAGNQQAHLMKETNQNTVTSLVKNLKLDKKNRQQFFRGKRNGSWKANLLLQNRNYLSAPGRVLPGFLFQMISLGINRSVFPKGNPSVWDSKGAFRSKVMSAENP